MRVFFNALIDQSNNLGRILENRMPVVFVVGVRVICTMHVPRVLLAIGNTTTATLELATYITQPPTLNDVSRN